MFARIVSIPAKKAKHIGFTLFIAGSLATNLAIAADDSFEFQAALKFAGGIVSAAMIHEGAHALVAAGTGTSMSWRVGDATQPLVFTERSKNDVTGLAINSAGLLAQAGVSEVILCNDKIDKNDNYIRGMMLWNIVHPVVYAIDYWFVHNTNQFHGNTYKGDLQGIEFYGNKKSADIFAGTMVAIAAFEAYRYVKTQSWAPEWLTGKGKPEHLSLVPLPSGGAFLSYTLQFG